MNPWENKARKMIGNTKVPKIGRDTDGDGVPNVLDCEPYNKHKQGVIHDLQRKFVNKTLKGKSKDDALKVIRRKEKLSNIKKDEEYKHKEQFIKERAEYKYKQKLKAYKEKPSSKEAFKSYFGSLVKEGKRLSNTRIKAKPKTRKKPKRKRKK